MSTMNDSNSCPMCGNPFLTQGHCLQCGEERTIVPLRPRVAKWETALAIFFCVAALGLSGRGIQLGIDLIRWHSTVGPRASEFDAGLSFSDWVALVVDVGGVSLKRSMIIAIWCWIVPIAAFFLQFLREWWGACRIPRRRLFWQAELVTWGLTLSLAIVTLIWQQS